MRAPISKVVVARRFKSWHGRAGGEEEVGSLGCGKEEGNGDIGIYTDTRVAELRPGDRAGGCPDRQSDRRYRLPVARRRLPHISGSRR
jgi:hypothetical protein